MPTASPCRQGKRPESGRINRRFQTVRFVTYGDRHTFRWQIEIIGLDNAYEPPTTDPAALPQPPITDSDVRQLIHGADIETLAFYDVSDCQIYGRKHRRKLTGRLADAAKAAGCQRVVYQTVLWWCLVYMPVFPLGVYFVIPCVECDDPDGDAEQYRGIRAQWDFGQITLHYIVMLSLLLGAGVATWWLFR